jgi:hypothetical protein
MKTKSLLSRSLSVMCASMLLVGSYASQEASAATAVEYELMGAFTPVVYSLGLIIAGVQAGHDIVPMYSVDGRGSFDRFTKRNVRPDPTTGAQTEQVDRVEVRISGEILIAEALVWNPMTGVYDHQVRASELGRDIIARPKAMELFTNEALQKGSLLLLDEPTTTHKGETCLSAPTN